MSEYPTYLVHYGIEGQKWGVRRFQNEDGTYTEEGLKRREKGHFISEQRNTNKAFDKITSKMQRNQEKGKRVSDKKYNKQYNKAVELGTKHRALDYISKNPRAYLKAHGLNKASGAKFGVQLGAGITAATNPYTASMAPGIIADAIVEKKLENMFMKKWMRRQYGDVFDKCKDLTIKDLEAHGIRKRT